MKRVLIVALLSCASAIGGCRVSTAEAVLMRYLPQQRARTQKAPYNGPYRLYATTARRPTTRSATPAIDRRLRHGEIFGFAFDDQHRLLAVCGSERVLLPADAAKSEYVWTMQPEQGQIDPARTALFFFGMSVIVGAAVGMAIASSTLSFSLMTL